MCASPAETQYGGVKPKGTHSCVTLAVLRSLGKEQAALSGLAKLRWGFLKSGLCGMALVAA